MKHSSVSMVIYAIACMMHSTYATFIVKGNDPNSPFGFTQEVSVTSYDPFTGIFFVGLNQDPCPSTMVTTGTYALSYSGRPYFYGMATFKGLIEEGDMQLSNMPIELMSLSRINGILPIVGVTIRNCSTPFAGTEVIAIQQPQTPSIASGDINDANGAAGNIIALAGSPCIFFELIRSAGQMFGELGSGIAMVSIERNEYGIMTNLAPKNATTGMPGNLARPLNISSPELTGGTNDVSFQIGAGDINAAALYYDYLLERLYIGVRITSGSTGGDVLKSLVVGYINQNNNNSLDLLPCAPSSVINGDNNQIIVGENTGTQQNATIIQLKAMHLSTGPDYLIMVGDLDSSETVQNRVRALPLVNDPSNPLVHGTLADKNAPLMDGKFVTPATGTADLALTTDPAAIVGAQPLPIMPENPISQLVVAGDTVYIALTTPPDGLNDTGVFFSQPMFDASGKIVRWIPWQRATPFNAFPGFNLPCCGCHTGPILACVPDEQTGNIWVVEGNCNKVVGITSWNSNRFMCNPLSIQLQCALHNGCFCVRDINQATRGLLDATINRYVLFGGCNKVAFALVSQASMVNSPSSPETVITDFDNPENFLVTPLNGMVQSLEYAQQTESDGPQNYFFAGTDNGLYVFADLLGNGFDVSALSTLNLPPFAFGVWHQVPSFLNPVVAVKTLGNRLYLLTYSAQPTIVSTLYSIGFAPTLEAMFDPTNVRIIAQTGNDIFSNTLQFYNFEIVSTGTNFDDPYPQEQLILATNQGLYLSYADQITGNGIIDAIDQTTAAWQIIGGTQTELYTGITAAQAPVHSTVLPWGLALNNCHAFTQGVLYQLSVTSTQQSDGKIVLETGFAPLEYVSDPYIPSTQSLPPILTVWSDGNRRFFVVKSTQNSNQNNLLQLPYKIALANIPRPAPLSNPGLYQARGYYWVHPIGATGFVMAGVQNGVVVLE